MTSALGEINLRPGTILRIERAKLIPCLRRGILISHRRHDFPSLIGFVPLEIAAQELLHALEKYGYSVLW